MFHVKHSILKFSQFGFTQIEPYKVFHVKHSIIKKSKCVLTPDVSRETLNPLPDSVRMAIAIILNQSALSEKRN